MTGSLVLMLPEDMHRQAVLQTLHLTSGGALVPKAGWRLPWSTWGRAPGWSCCPYGPTACR